MKRIDWLENERGPVLKLDYQSLVGSLIYNYVIEEVREQHGLVHAYLINQVFLHQRLRVSASIAVLNTLDDFIEIIKHKVWSEDNHDRKMGGPPQSSRNITDNTHTLSNGNITDNTYTFWGNLEMNDEEI